MKKGIKARLITPLLVMIAMLFTVFIVFLNLRLRKISQNDIENTVKHVGDVAVQLVRSPIFYADYVSLVNAINPLIPSYFDYFLVYDSITGNTAFFQDFGNVLPDNYMSKFGNTERFNKKSRQEIFLKGKKYFEFVFPAFIANVRSPIGFVIIGISQKKINEVLFPVTIWIMAMGLATIVLVMLAAYFIPNRFIVPLEQLTRTMTDFSAGDYTARSAIRSEDEIGVLSKTYNQMADKINEQIARIETYSRDLKKMVEERSRKLVEALGELREKDIKLEQAKRIRSLNDLATSIAHQINNPMAIISGHVQMIEAESRDKQIAHRMSSIHNSINRIDGLIRDITFYLSLRDISLEEKPLRDLVAAISRELIPPGVKTEFIGFAETSIRIPINYDLMSIALKNVILNALEAIAQQEAEKRITFRLAREQDYLRLEIEDNGPGIAEPERAFEPFFSGSPDKSGMGLTIAYQIVRIHNGDIRIENTGSGTRVTMKFPIRVNRES